MSIWITDSGGIANKRIGYTEPLQDCLANEIISSIAAWNINNPAGPSRYVQLVEGNNFPPTGKKLVEGLLADMTTQEKIDAGIVMFNPATQKVVDSEITQKTNQELVTSGVKSLSDVKNENIMVVSYNIDRYLELTAVTPGGYRPTKRIRETIAIAPSGLPSELVTEVKAIVADMTAAEASAITSVLAATTVAGAEAAANPINYIPGAS